MPDLPVIMLIRHAEKADETGQTGVHPSGKDDDHSLSVEGWQRAGALVPLFVSSDRPRLDPRLPQPATLIAEFAAAPGSEEKHSKREEQTFQPLAKMLGIQQDFRFGKGEEAEAAEAARNAAGPVLIAWEHHKILDLAAELTADPLPKEWPKDRYDVVLLFTPNAQGSYSMQQVPQLLLGGDIDAPIR